MRTQSHNGVWLRGLFTVSVVIASCGPEVNNPEGTQTIGSGGSMDDVSSGGMTTKSTAEYSCSCFSRELTDSGSSGISMECSSGAVCPPIAIECSGDWDVTPCPKEDLKILNPTALTCTLNALKATTVGTISWAVLYVDGGPGAIRRHVVHVDSDCTAFWYRSEEQDIVAEVSDVFYSPLTPAEFGGCAEMTESSEKFICLRDIFEQLPGEACAL